MSTPATHEEIVEAEARAHSHAEEIEQRAEMALARSVNDLKVEMRWLIVASVGLNQILGNLDLTGVAKAGIVGVLAVVAKAGVTLFSRA